MITIVLCGFVVSLARPTGSLLAFPDFGGRALEQFHALWPQRWAFFTGMSEKQVLVLYRLGDDGVGEAVNQRQRWFDHSWGLNKAGSALDREIADIATRIPQRHWQECGLSMTECPVRTDFPWPFVMSNPTSSRLACGRFIVAAEYPDLGGGISARHPRLAEWFAVVDVRCG